MASGSVLASRPSHPSIALADDDPQAPSQRTAAGPGDGEASGDEAPGTEAPGTEATGDEALGKEATAIADREGVATRVLELMATGFVALSREWTITFINAQGERIVGRHRSELLGRNLWDAFPGAEELEFGEQYHRAMDTGEPVAFEAFYPGLGQWFEIRAVASEDGLGVYFLDVTARRALQDESLRAAERSRLVGDVSRELADTLDGNVAVARLAQLVVPHLADWCVITLVDAETGDLHDVGLAHRDPADLPYVQAYADAQIANMTSAAPIWRVLDTGEPVVAPRIRPEVLEAVFPDPQVRALLLPLVPTSGVAVPLSARGAALGVLALWISGDRPSLTPDEVTLAVDIGRRAGLALDNARLYAAQRRVSEVLQHSLLTEPPQPDHCEIVVRYVPATHEVQVGGDWYDAFLTPSGATVLAIGDVVGHDTHAAAAMGQVRGLLRGIAFTTGEGPAAVLGRLDRAIEGLMLHTLATAITCRLEQDAADVDQATTRLRWSNAGHPPAMVIAPDGSVRILDNDHDLMLGVSSESFRHETVTVLARGATVFLYTDGLIERRDTGIDDGLATLAALLAELAELPLDALCDTVLARLVPADNEDDVAVLAVRLHPQDVPRPIEAGPVRIPPHLQDTAGPA